MLDKNLEVDDYSESWSDKSSRWPWRGFSPTLTIVVWVLAALLFFLLFSYLIIPWLYKPSRLDVPTSQPTNVAFIQQQAHRAMFPSGQKTQEPKTV